MEKCSITMKMYYEVKKKFILDNPVYIQSPISFYTQEEANNASKKAMTEYLLHYYRCIVCHRELGQDPKPNKNETNFFVISDPFDKHEEIAIFTFCRECRQKPDIIQSALMIYGILEKSCPGSCNGCKDSTKCYYLQQFNSLPLPPDPVKKYSVKKHNKK